MPYNEGQRLDDELIERRERELKFQNATREQLEAVVKAADDRWKSLTNFDGPPYKIELALDEALRACPGTEAARSSNGLPSPGVQGGTPAPEQVPQG